MTQRTLFVSDMDGTLLNTQSRISDTSARIISALSESGALITVATARTPATVEPLLKGTFTSIPAVVMTGAALWDRKLHRYLSTRPLSNAVASEVTEELRGAGIEPFVYTFGPEHDMLEVYSHEPLSAPMQEFMTQRIASKLKRFHIGSDAPEANQVMLLFSIGPKEQIFDIAARLRERGDCAVSAFTDTTWPDMGLLEIFAKGVDKASALLRLKHLLGADKMVVYGDNLNDLPMFAVADEAIAVGNALDEVKTHATKVIGDNDADSVAKDIACRLGRTDLLQ